MTIQFRSVAHEKDRCYTLETDIDTFWNQIQRGGCCQFVDVRAGQYETYGDGMVQHNTTFAVPIQDLGDWCVSLCQHLLHHPEDREFAAKALRWQFVVHEGWAEKIQFLRSLKYDETKTRYFSAEERKVSSSESKRYDKRWEKVPTDAGNTDWIWCQLISGDLDGGLKAYVFRCEFAEKMNQAGGYYNESGREWLKIESRDVVQAVRCLKELIGSIHSLEYATNILECYLANVARREVSCES